MANRTSSLRALGIGFVAGLRSMTAPAAVSWAASNGRLSLGNSPLALLDSARAEHTTRKLALGEFVTDKTPLLPSRLKPASLLWRLISGGVCGAAFSLSDGEKPASGRGTRRHRCAGGFPARIRLEDACDQAMANTRYRRSIAGRCPRGWTRGCHRLLSDAAWRTRCLGRYRQSCVVTLAVLCCSAEPFLLSF